MTQVEKQQLKALFVKTGQYFDQIIPDEVLRLYVEDLADLSFPKVAQAMGMLRRDPMVKRCPLPSQIRAKLTPESNTDSEAVLLVGRITDAISRIGPYNTTAAREYVGPSGWEVVKLSGGWENICSLTTDTLATHKAQWRMLAKAVLERGVYSKDIQISQDSYPGMSSLADILKSLPKPEDHE